jgi:phage shock protein PspC (stress-responsive transcriptional regulator)
MKKVYRARHNRMVAGVCMGLSDYFDVDVTLVRLVWVLAVLFGGSGLLAYLIAWIIIPEEPLVDGHIIESKNDNKGRISADSQTAGLIIIAIGLFFLLRNFFPFLFVRHLWPLILVFIGLILIFGGLRGEHS